MPDRERDPLLSIALRSELDKLPPDDWELVLLRCVNEVPVAVLSRAVRRIPVCPILTEGTHVLRCKYSA